MLKKYYIRIVTPWFPLAAFAIAVIWGVFQDKAEESEILGHWEFILLLLFLLTNFWLLWLQEQRWARKKFKPIVWRALPALMTNIIWLYWLIKEMPNAITMVESIWTVPLAWLWPIVWFINPIIEIWFAIGHHYKQK